MCLDDIVECTNNAMNKKVKKVTIDVVDLAKLIHHINLLEAKLADIPEVYHGLGEFIDKRG